MHMYFFLLPDISLCTSSLPSLQAIGRQGLPGTSMISATLLAAALAHVAQAAPFDYTQQTPISAQDHTQGYEFDPLQHLPGISPYDKILGSLCYWNKSC